MFSLTLMSKGEKRIGLGAFCCHQFQRGILLVCFTCSVCLSLMASIAVMWLEYRKDVPSGIYKSFGNMMQSKINKIRVCSDGSH
jgi:hypothetical protein